MIKAAVVLLILGVAAVNAYNTKNIIPKKGYIGGGKKYGGYLWGGHGGKYGGMIGGKKYGGVLGGGRIGGSIGNSYLFAVKYLIYTQQQKKREDMLLLN